MSRPASERALRRLVTELAAVAPGDVDEVLLDLPPADQSAVRRLLADYGAAPRAPVVAPPATPRLSTEGLSAWLVARLDDAPGARPGVRMTALARSALLEAAREAQPLAAAAPPAPTARESGWRGWWKAAVRWTRSLL